jgi:hypothetical protein
MTRWIVALPACFLAPGLAAQDGPTARAFCDPADPANGCPGASCICTEDVLALRFDPGGGPIIELDALEPGFRLSAEVVLETRSMSIQGWSYGVRHDGRALSIESVTTEGTDAGRLFANGFNATRSEVSDCGGADPAAGCPNPTPGAGFISAVVLSLVQNVALPVASNTIARAAYRLEPGAAETGEGGIPIEFTERLATRNSPPVQINFTDSGRSVRPKAIVDGRIVVSLAGADFHRGDPDGDGRLSVSDAVALLLFLFLAGPAPGCLDAGDVDDDGRIDTTDPVLILRWLFASGTAPAPPGPPPAPCGPDPEGPSSSLGCVAYGACG